MIIIDNRMYGLYMRRTKWIVDIRIEYSKCNRCSRASRSRLSQLGVAKEIDLCSSVIITVSAIDLLRCCTVLEIKIIQQRVVHTYFICDQPEYWEALKGRYVHFDKAIRIVIHTYICIKLLEP